MSCGIWTCEPGRWRIAFAPNKQEFFHVLEGRLRLHDSQGGFEEFGPGQAAVRTGGRWIDMMASESSAASIAVEPVLGVARIASRCSQKTSMRHP